MQIDREPNLEQLRVAANELKRLADGEPNEVSIGAAWREIEKVKDALARLTPNHPAILRHL